MADIKPPPGLTLDEPNQKITPPPGLKLDGPPGKVSGGPTGKDFLSVGLEMLPAVGATAAAAFQPELAPVVGGFWARTAAASSLAAAGGAAGSLIQQGGQTAARLPERPKSAGEFATRLGKEAGEQALYEAGGRLVAKPFEFVASKLKPSRLYQSALNPSTTLKVPKREAIIQTGLREGIPTSEKGYEKLVSAINDLTGEIDKKIAAKSPQLGEIISPKVVARRLEALEHFYEQQAAPKEDLDAIRNVRDQFLKKHSYEAPFSEVKVGTEDAEGQIIPTGKQGSTTVYKDMNLAEAQAEKRGTQRFNANKFGERGTARDEAEKALAYSLKRQISSLFPEIQSLNARDSAMLELEEQLQRYVGREGNKNVVGLIPAVIGAGAGILGASTGNKAEEWGGGGLLAASLLAIDNPEIKSKLAIALARAAKNRVGSSLLKAGARLGKEGPSIAARTVDVLSQ